MDGLEFTIGGTLDIQGTKLKVSSKETLSRGNGCIGIGNTNASGTSGSGNIIIGDNASTSSPNSINRIILGNGISSSKDNSIFTYSGLSPVVGIPSMLMYDNMSGQIGPAVSSRIYKRNIKPMRNSLSRRIFNLKPRTYIFRDDKNKEKCIGLIAEDVVKTIPQIVSKNNGKPADIRYDLLSVLMLNEMKRIRFRRRMKY